MCCVGYGAEFGAGHVVGFGVAFGAVFVGAGFGAGHGVTNRNHAHRSKTNCVFKNCTKASDHGKGTESFEKWHLLILNVLGISPQLQATDRTYHRNSLFLLVLILLVLTSKKTCIRLYMNAQNN